MNASAIKTFKSTALLEEKFIVKCESRGHTIIFDEEKVLGGDNAGMNPIEAALAALGACQCVIARLFAESQGVELVSLRMELEGDLQPTSMTSIIEGSNGMRIQEIRSKVFIKANASDEKITALIKFVEHNCPIADLLKNPAQMIPTVIIER